MHGIVSSLTQLKKCFAKCGFDVVEESDLDDEEEDEVEPYVISFLSE